MKIFHETGNRGEKEIITLKNYPTLRAVKNFDASRFTQIAITI
jgi:hypothetical protein